MSDEALPMPEDMKKAFDRMCERMKFDPLPAPSVFIVDGTQVSSEAFVAMMERRLAADKRPAPVGIQTKPSERHWTERR